MRQELVETPLPRFQEEAARSSSHAQRTQRECQFTISELDPARPRGLVRAYKKGVTISRNPLLLLAPQARLELATR